MVGLSVGPKPMPPSLEELTACVTDMSSLKLHTERQAALCSVQAAAVRWQGSAVAALSPRQSIASNVTSSAPNACAVEQLTAEGVLLFSPFET